MTESLHPDPRPFWQRKRLDEMTPEEWEALCDGCGRCCLHKMEADDTLRAYPLDMACRLLDLSTCRCSDYTNRLTLQANCVGLTPANVPKCDWLPATCGYRLVHEGKDLSWWHPLVSGRPETVREAGVTAGGRIIAHDKVRLPIYHTVDWPNRFPAAGPDERWHDAMFGGINASVPTCFDAGKGIDLDLMAAHCLWLFSTGCHGLLVLDKTGEVASLTTNERIAVLQGLAARGVPASKLIAGIGPASPVDSARIAACANELGIRGVLVTAIASGKIMPQDVIPDALRTIILSCPASLHVYVSFNVSHHAIPTCLTAVEAFNAETGGRLTGIRDETSGSKFGLAAIDRFCGARFEVYGSDETVLGDLIAAGGSGLMSGGANLLGRHCRQVLDAPQPHIAAILARTIEAVSRMLRSSPMVPSLKTLLVHHTGQANWGRMRLPLRSLTPAEREAVFRLVDSSGLKLRPAEPVR